MGSGLFFFLFLIASFLGIVIVISWLFTHKKEIRRAIRSPHTIQHKADPTIAGEKFVEAIHSSVRRYKELYQSAIGNTFHWTAHSKRYVLKISLSVIKSNKYILTVDLEGNHQHKFSLKRSGWFSGKLYFSSSPLKESGISRSEIVPFLNPLDFFDNITANEGILSARRTLRSDSSMENWPQALGAFIRLASYLMDTGLRKEILAAKDVLCPYCRGDFSQMEGTVSCHDCKTRHHKECWEEVGRCSVFGCNCKSEMIVTQL